MLTRRRFVRDGSLISSVAALCPTMHAAFEPGRTPMFQNPIMGGDHPDIGAIRVGDDFYLTHSSFDFTPGLVIWHSKDLVNWQPVAAALKRYHGSVYAPYLCEHEGRFYIYFPAAHRIMVVHADHPTGPWSEPVDLGIVSIDPGHIAEDGRRFLYLASGQMAELTSDGLAVKVKPRTVVQPWPVPASIRIECTCLEAPKLLFHKGYYYLNVAEGGTAGPGTSHFVVSARSRHADGPWEFSPYNPIAHTQSREDRWLSLGHGRLVDTKDGRWYMMAHAYENGYRSLGRQPVLLPMEYTADGWFRELKGAAASSPEPMPVAGREQLAFFDPSDDFTSGVLGLQWGFWHELDQARIETGKGYLKLAAKGNSLEDSGAMTTAVGGHSYTIEADIEIEQGCEAGLLLFYNPQHATGLVMDDGGIALRTPASNFRTRAEAGVRRAQLRVVNDRQEVDFYYRVPGRQWAKTEGSVEISGMQHNVFGGYLSVRPAIYASRSGSATIRGFRYWPKAIAPEISAKQ